MRTKVSLHPDVESMLREEVRRRGEPFKQVLNAIRARLPNMRMPAETSKLLTFDMGKPRVDLTKASPLAAEMEDHELIERYRRSRWFSRTPPRSGRLIGSIFTLRSHPGLSGRGP